MIEIEDKDIQLPHNDVADYSDEFVELYRRQPSWIVKWGIAVISVSFLLLLFLTFYIKYPDIIGGKAKITSSNPPSVVIVRSEGLLTEIEVLNGATVKKGQIIACIKNTVDLNNYKKLKNTLKNIEHLAPSDYVNLQLGELQQYYNDFLLQLKNAQLKGRLAHFKKKNTQFSGDIIALQKTIKRQQHKKELYLEELRLSEKDLIRSRTLFSKGIISQKELDDKEQQFTSIKRTFEDFDMELLKLQMQLSEIGNSSELLRIDSSENLDIQNETSRNARKALEEKIKEWENKYLLTASSSGVVSYISSAVYNNSNVQLGNALMSITPLNTGTIKVNIETPAAKAGKLKLGQRANIYLDNYPSEEFGILKGKVSKIASMPNQEGLYLVEAVLPQKMTTSYNKLLTFQPNLTGSAEIVTEDLSLFQRIFYQFYKLAHNN